MSLFSRSLLEFCLDHLVWFILAAALAIFSLTIPNFFQSGIFVNIIEQSTYVGILAVGLSLVIIAGYMDLSIESVAGLTAMIVSILFCSHGIGKGIVLTPQWLALPASLLLALTIGAIIGLSNGWLVTKFKLNAFIVTLASYIWVHGLVDAVSGGRSAQDLEPWLRSLAIQTLLGIPLIPWVAVLCFALFTFILTKTPFGRHIILVGGNPVAAFRAGIKSERLVLLTFVIAGAVAGLAGWLLAIRTSGATANLGVGMLFKAFAAVVIGGVSLKGGLGKLPGVYAGALLLASIQTAMNVMALPVHFTNVIFGLLVLAAVLLDSVKLAIRQKLA